MSIQGSDEQNSSTAEQQSPRQTSPRPWRRWQWPVSIVASAVFVSVIIFSQYEQFDPNLDANRPIPADTREIAQQSSLDEQQLAERSRLQQKLFNQAPKPAEQADRMLPDRQQFEQELISEPALSNYAEQEAQTLAARALDGVEIDINLDVLLAEPTATPDKQNPQVAQQGAANPDSDSGTDMNMEYLDQLLASYQLAQQQHQADNPTGLTPSELQQIQLTMFNYLSLLKTAQPNKAIAAKYLQALTKSQRQALGDQSGAR